MATQRDSKGRFVSPQRVRLRQIRYRKHLLLLELRDQNLENSTITEYKQEIEIIDNEIHQLKRKLKGWK